MKADSADSSGPLRTLAEAAERLGCHEETLRRRIRAGELAAARGAHGRYLVDDVQIANLWVQPGRGRRPRTDVEASWAALAAMVYQYEQTHNEAIALLGEVRRDPSRRPRLARTVEAQRLRVMGTTYADIARQLNISERHVRRIAHRDLEIVLRVELIHDRHRALADAWRHPRALLLAIETRLRAAGYTGLGREEIKAAWPRRIGVLHKRLSLENRRVLRRAGVTLEEIAAIESAGLPSQALEYLLKHGFGTPDPMGHTTAQNDEAR